MKTRILHTKIYSDNFFITLSPLEKFLFIYYITNESVNIIHCYECPNRKVQFDTGINTPIIEAFQRKMESAGKMFFKDGYVLLKNADKYEKYNGELNDKAKLSLINELSIGIREWYEGGMKGVYIPTINHNTEIINQKEGVVKGKQVSEELITDTEFQQIADDYHVPISFVLSKYEDMTNWCKSKGKRYRDYKAALRNWVKKDAVDIAQKSRGDPHRQNIDATNIL